MTATKMKQDFNYLEKDSNSFALRVLQGKKEQHVKQVNTLLAMRRL